MSIPLEEAGRRQETGGGRWWGRWWMVEGFVAGRVGWEGEGQGRLMVVVVRHKKEDREGRCPSPVLVPPSLARARVSPSSGPSPVSVCPSV